jgi:hypothetical protein
MFVDNLIITVKKLLKKKEEEITNIDCNFSYGYSMLTACVFLHFFHKLYIILFSYETGGWMETH